MKLPKGEHAIIDEEKILNYLLDPLHREGRHHAELFRRLIGVTRDSWTHLYDALRTAARDGEAIPGKKSKFGTKYEIRFSMTGPRETRTILSVWMIRFGRI
ncbi:MAG TPA: hypothetical protein VG722_01910 [Tepidisphaeraceae bacterium]|nr:hypothetical protein [Tepidisphaeraceae bacterium]